MWALAQIVFALAPMNGVARLAPDTAAAAPSTGAAMGHKDIRKILAERAARTSLLQTLEGRAMIADSSSELQDTFAKKSPWPEDLKQKKKINDLIEGNDYLQKRAADFTHMFNLYTGILADLKTNYDMQEASCEEWRKESRMMWRDLKRKVTRRLEDFQGTEEKALRRIFDELFLTYAAIGSMFKYESQKMAWIRNSLSKKQQELFTLDKHYTNYVENSCDATEGELNAATDKINEKRAQVAEFYDAAIHNGYNALEKAMNRHKKNQDFTVTFLNQVMFDGGARTDATPARYRNSDAWKPASDTEKGFWQAGASGPNAKKWPAGGSSLTEKGVEATKLALGFAVQAYDTVSDELRHRNLSEALAERGSLAELAREGEMSTDLDRALQGKFFEAVGDFFTGRGRRRGPKPPPPPDPNIKPLEPLLQATQERAEKVAEGADEKTVEINQALNKVEKAEMDRDKGFTKTEVEVHRLTQADSDRRIGEADQQWENILLKHQRTLLALETDLYTAVTDAEEQTKQAFDMGYQATKHAKKMRLRELGEIRRELKQIQKKLDQVLIDAKTATGEMNVDIAKASTKMDGEALAAQASAKKIEKEDKKDVKAKFAALDATIQQATTNDIHQVDQTKSQLESDVTLASTNGKEALLALKRELQQLDSAHDAMFAKSESWIESFNDQLLALGNNIQKFARSSLKDAQQMEYDLERKRQKNTDALATQQQALGRKTNEVLQMISLSKNNLLGEQSSMWTKSQKGLKRTMDGDASGVEMDAMRTEGEMKQVQDAIDSAGRRHTQSLKTTQEQLDSVNSQMPSAQNEVEQTLKKVNDVALAAKEGREALVNTFKKNVDLKFSMATTTQKAAIAVDAKNAQRDMGAAQAAFQGEADAALKSVEEVKNGVTAAKAEFQNKENAAQGAVERVAANEAAITRQIKGEYKDVSKAAEADQEAQQRMQASLEEYVMESEKKLHDYANSVLSTVSAPAVAAFKGQLQSREEQIQQIVMNTQETFSQKEALIQAVNFQIVEKLEALEKQSARTTSTLEKVSTQEAQAQAAAALAEEHAKNAAAEEAALAARSTAEIDGEREERMRKYQKQVRKQGHFASAELDKAIGKVAEDAEAEIQQIRDAEHLTEREKQRKIKTVEAAAEKAVAQMAQTEAAAGRELSAFEMLSSKWGSDLAAHLGDLEEALQQEELQRARRLARSKRDLADMSARFHESVKEVKEHLQKAAADGKIVLTPDEIAELHAMEAKAHADLQVHLQEAAKEERIAALLEQKIERSGEMSQQEIDNLETKLMLLTGTSSAGITSLKSRTSDLGTAREQALQAQNHFAAASVGQALSAVSQMAEFLVAGTRVSGLKQEALDRQQQKLQQVLTSPLANLQEELGIKTKKLEENENKIETYANDAKEWATTYESRVKASEEKAKDAMAAAQKNYNEMGDKVNAELNGVSKAATQAMQNGMEEIDREAAFDAKKAGNDLSKVADQNAAFGEELEHRAQKSLNIATNEADRIKYDEYQRFVALDASDTQLAGAIEQLNKKSSGMIKEAQEMSGRVAAAVNANLYAAEQKRAAAGSELARLNRDVAAASGNDPGLAASAAEITSSLEASDVSDAALEKLTAELEQHNAHEAAATAQAEQVNADVRKKLK